MHRLMEYIYLIILIYLIISTLFYISNIIVPRDNHLRLLYFLDLDIYNLK